MLPLRRALAAAIVWTIAAAPALAAVGGLPSAKISQLRALGFEVVVPNPPPPGFRYKAARVDSIAESYSVTYERPGDNATLIFSGRKLAAPATPEPKKRHGFFNQLADEVQHIGVRPTTANNQVAASGGQTNSSTSQETEEEMSSVQAYSPVIGPGSFAEDHGCLTGSPDPAQAPIHDATYTVTGCNLVRPDALTRAYRSLVRLGS